MAKIWHIPYLVFYVNFRKFYNEEKQQIDGDFRRIHTKIQQPDMKNQNPTSKFDVLEVVEVTPRKQVEYPASMLGVELGPYNDGA